MGSKLNISGGGGGTGGGPCMVAMVPCLDRQSDRQTYTTEKFTFPDLHWQAVIIHNL